MTATYRIALTLFLSLIAAPAWALPLETVTFYVKGTCNGQANVDLDVAVATAMHVKGADVTIFDIGQNRVQWATAAVQGRYYPVFVGPGELHAVSFFPSGDYFVLNRGDHVAFLIGCTGGGTYQAYVTLYCD